MKPVQKTIDTLDAIQQLWERVSKTLQSTSSLEKNIFSLSKLLRTKLQKYPFIMKYQSYSQSMIYGQLVTSYTDQKNFRMHAILSRCSNAPTNSPKLKKSPGETVLNQDPV